MKSTAEGLTRAIRHAFLWHDRYSTKPGKRFRGPRNEPRKNPTPAGIHPVWPAMTILHENHLPEDIRWQGAFALCYHDILEDTTAPLPKDLPKKIRQIVEAMTFVNFDEEAETLWEKPPKVRLFKLYDKVSNWMDGDWMYPERRVIHRAHLKRLADDVEKNFGLLNIVKMARALTSED